MILISEFMDKSAVHSLRNTRDVVYRQDLADKPDELQALIPGVHALIVRNRTQVTRDLLKAAPNLRCIGRLGVGLENIDLNACREFGVTVYPATRANDRSVAEYVIASGMILLRNAYFAKRSVIRGAWPRAECIGAEIDGKRLGLIGFGSIGQLTAQLAAGLGMFVAAFDPFLPDQSPAWQLAKRMELHPLLEDSDIVSMHVPLTSETRNLIDGARLRLLKPSAVIVNSSRGGIIDETALANALKAGNLGGAALDVFEEEPLNGQSAAVFENIDNLILTPHIAGVTTESNHRVSSLIAERVLEHLKRTD